MKHHIIEQLTDSLTYTHSRDILDNIPRLLTLRGIRNKQVYLSAVAQIAFNGCSLQSNMYIIQAF